MFGIFINRVLLLLLGYAYPAFECFKDVEKETSDIEQFRFWCQYWIIVAMLTVIERFSDFFISWFPMYFEAKVAFFLYLWYPKIKGTSFVYETLRPYFVKYEPDIDQMLLDLNTGSRDWLLIYIKTFTSKGQSVLSEALHYMLPQLYRGSLKTKERPLPHPSNIVRSMHQAPSTDKAYYKEPDVMEVAGQSQFSAGVEEAVLVSHVNQKRSAPSNRRRGG